MRLNPICLLLLLGATPALSQDYWRPANGPYGDSIEELDAIGYVGDDR